MTDFHTHYNQLVEATGTTPGRQLHQQLERLHEAHPAAFAAKVTEVINGYQAGRINSPWPFLRSTLQLIDQHRPTTEHAAPERETAIRLAETWIRNAGLHAPLTEVHLELYGEPDDPRGRLAPWHTSQELRDRIDAHWQAQQPRAQQAEADMLERAAKFKASRTPATDTDEPERWF